MPAFKDITTQRFGRLAGGPVVHGHARPKSPTYQSWDKMLQRCNNPNHVNYKNYGGRGIRVCRRWRKFVNFLADMDIRPPGMSIDRVDNDKGYCIGNCRWATPAQQTENRRLIGALEKGFLSMPKRSPEHSAAIKIASELMRAAKSGEDVGLVEMMAEVNARLRKPMGDVLRKVPGRTIKDKAERIGVSRQAFYDWLKGLYRPTGAQAKRLARLTGMPVEHIRGKGEQPRKRRKPAASSGTVA